MKVHVRVFAGLVALVGAREVEVEIGEGATADDLKAAVGEVYPATGLFLRNVVCAVGEDYVSGGYVLHADDQVALIPPVSGGSR